MPHKKKYRTPEEQLAIQRELQRFQAILDRPVVQKKKFIPYYGRCWFCRMYECNCSKSRDV